MLLLDSQGNELGQPELACSVPLSRMLQDLPRCQPFLSLSSVSSSSVCDCRAMNDDLAVLNWQTRCMCYAQCPPGEKPVIPTVATTAPPPRSSHVAVALNATSLQMVRVCVRLVDSQVRNEHAVRTNRCVYMFFLGFMSGR